MINFTIVFAHVRRVTVDAEYALRLLSARLAERETAAAVLTRELESLRASASWRLTRPLRALARLVRRRG